MPTHHFRPARKFAVALCMMLPIAAGCATETSATKRSLADIAAIEQRIGGRLGVALVSNTGSVMFSHRGEQRFAMCSTFKAALAAAMLAAHQRGDLNMFAPVDLNKNDLVPYAPFVEQRLTAGEPVTLHELAKAALQLSDNAAANLVLKAIGGPAGFTAFVRANGDVVTRLDRIEPELNFVNPGDARDTTSPVAMGQLMQRLFLGGTTPDSDKQTLQQWLQGSTTGFARIRAGLPVEWPVGDKTGTGPNGSAYNDVAILWPSACKADRPPVALAIFTDRPTAPARQVDAAIADVARIASRWLENVTPAQTTDLAR
jgi:beta-lactamase class A